MSETVTDTAAKAQKLRHDAIMRRLHADVAAGQTLSGAMAAARQDVYTEAEVRAAGAQVRQDLVRVLKRQALKRFGFGVFWLFLAGAVAVASYLSASESGGSHILIAWGAILFGGFRFIAGLFGYLGAGNKIE